MDSRRIRLILGAILVCALALRLGYVLSQRSDVLFEHPVLDEGRYVDSARALIAGHGEDRPYWQPPGIVYALAATFEVAGQGLLAPRIVQVLVSVASCLLLFAIGRRMFDARVGLAAAGILALHGVLVFECDELLPATWIVFFDLLALLLLLRALERRRAIDALVAGLAIGVSALFAPTILPFVAVAAVLLRRPLAIAALVAGVLLPIVPVTARNFQHGGEVVAVSTNAGLNLYIGNNADYRDTFALRPGRHWEELTTEPARHGIDQPGASSTYFEHQALAFVVDHPGSAVALTARKLYLFVNGAEIPRDTDIDEARDSSWLLAGLVWPRFGFPDALLVPIALLGIAAVWRERRRLAAPLGLLATIAATTVIFFVTSRHRAPALPLFALFAAAGVQRWLGWPVRVRRLALAGAAALVVVLNIPTWETELAYPGELDFYRGLAAHDPDSARAAFQRATEANPNDARAWFELGNVLRGRDAIAAWQHAADLDPWDSRARRRIAQAQVQAGDLDGAIATLQASIAAHLRDDAHYAPDYLNLAFMQAQRGQRDAALANLAAAVRADREYVARTAPRMAQAVRRDPAADPEFLRALDAIGPR
ncbi:MAG TPA: glycosyltransferase family 39 protein [Kofleriaceae bacterium]|jgi:tetratricopeptide (TPR) repeat protein